jgi:hypothetical protein
MRALELMAAVLPPPGHGRYCVAALSSKRKEHAFGDTLEELVPHIKRWFKQNRDIYFAMATFDPQQARRLAVNAQFVQSIFIDIDGYATRSEAGAALYEFLEKTGIDQLGLPYVVSSGGGLHCYWPLTEPADIATWKPIAENLKRLCAQEKLVIDMTVTADAARVLRVPGTFNHKAKYGTPRPVKLLREGTGPIDLRRFGATVRAQLSAKFAPASNAFVPETVQLAGQRPSKAQHKRSAAAEALMANQIQRFETIWIKSEEGSGCAQLKHYLDNASEDGMEPLWRGLLSWAKFCDDGDEQAAKLSELHPYEPARMQQKLQEIKGPYPCIKLDTENPGVCPGCPHWGKITNGLALGREVQTNNVGREIEIPANTLPPAEGEQELDTRREDNEFGVENDAPQNATTRRVKIPPPPKGFSYGNSGGIYVEIRERDATGVEIKTQVEVLPHELFVVDLLKLDDQEHRVHLMAIKRIGGAGLDQTQYTSIIVPSKAVVSKDEMLKCLAAHNVYASRGSVDQYLFNYVRACVNEATMMRKALEVPIQFGWQKDRSFVYNNRVFRADGTESVVPMPGLENLNRITNSKGTLEGWRKPWQLLIERRMYTMLAMCVDSFGSTLMHFSNHEGFVWHIGSTASGTGKSLTLSLKAGVWGHPVRYRTSKGTSPVAMQQRAGLLNSLPLLSDEITSKARNDVEWAPAFIFDFAEGQGKERMESSANKERLNNTTWASTCTMTSNVHMVDLLTGARKHASQGELMRMLEWTPTAELQFNDAERSVLQNLRNNYGVAGEAWVRWCACNYETAAKVWRHTHTALRGELDFSDEERIWHAACTSLVAAAVLLGEHYSGLLDLPVNALIGALSKLVQRARAVYRTSARSAEDVLNGYIREYHGKFVVLRKDAAGQLLADLGADLAGKTSTRSIVMGRVEHGTVREGAVEFFVEEHLLRQHCVTMSFGFADFKREMMRLKDDGFDVRFNQRKDMLAKVDGPSLRVTAMHLTIPKDRFDAQGTVSMG